MYGDREPPQSSPCESCMPVFYEENKDALWVFSVISNQFIMSMNGPVDINHMAIWKTIEKYGIKEERKTFEKVLKLSSWHLNRIMEKRE